MMALAHLDVQSHTLIAFQRSARSLVDALLHVSPKSLGRVQQLAIIRSFGFGVP